MSAISDNTALLPIVSAELLSDCYQLQFERSQGLSFVLRRNFWACLSPKKESSALAFGGAEGSFLSTIASFPGHDACSLSCRSFRPSQAFGKQSKSVPQPWSTSGFSVHGKTPHSGAQGQPGCESTLVIFSRVHRFFFAYCIAKFDLVFEISRFFFLLTNPAGASPGGMVADEVGVSGTGSKVPQPAK